MLVPSLQEGPWGLPGAPQMWPLVPAELLPGVSTNTWVFPHTPGQKAPLFSALFYSISAPVRVVFTGLSAAPLAERHVSAATGAWPTPVRGGCYGVCDPCRRRPSNSRAEREGARTFITSWGSTGDAHMHAGAHTHSHTA